LQTAKKKRADEGEGVSQLHEGLIVDVMHSESSTTMSPLTDSSVSTTSASISSSSGEQQNKPIKRRRSAKQASEANASKDRT
jgi:hypothetical protein